jgi:hypothetical protein
MGTHKVWGGVNWGIPIPPLNNPFMGEDTHFMGFWFADVTLRHLWLALVRLARSSPPPDGAKAASAFGRAKFGGKMDNVNRAASLKKRLNLLYKFCILKNNFTFFHNFLHFTSRLLSITEGRDSECVSVQQ